MKLPALVVILLEGVLPLLTRRTFAEPVALDVDANLLELSGPSKPRSPQTTLTTQPPLKTKLLCCAVVPQELKGMLPNLSASRISCPLREF